MHAEIEHTIAGGGFFSGARRFVVKLQVTLSPEENDIVNQRNLWKYVVINLPNPYWKTASERDREIMAETYKYDVQKLCKGIDPSFPDPLAAKNFATEARDHIKALKDFIDANKTIGTKEIFDL
jgi:hypothetical protein